MAPTEEQPGTLVFTSSDERKKPAATTKLASMGGAHQQSTPAARVDLPFRPDNAAVEDYPLIALPRTNDVIFGRGANIAHHPYVP